MNHLHRPAIDLEMFTPCPASEVAARPAGQLRRPINGLAAARAAGVDHDQPSEIVTQAVRSLHNGALPIG